jgi:beta-N-acetylhexosaminidase
VLTDLRKIPALTAVLIITASAILMATALTAIAAVVGSDTPTPRVVMIVRDATTAPATAPGRPAVARVSAAPSRAAATQHETSRSAASPTHTTSPSVARLVGQMLVVQMVGPRPSAALLQRVRKGQVGGIIVMGDAATDQLPAAVTQLQGAARDGGNPPLLIATDQEGGEVKRFAALPPTLSAAQMGQQSTAAVHAQGVRTGRALRDRGVNVDLAPVADVPTRLDSFIAREQRAFSPDPAIVARKAGAFARGLQAGGVSATVKHFPGLGSAPQNTDGARQTLNTSQAELQVFDRVIAAGAKLVMVSSAVYSNVDPTRPFVLSPKGPRMLRQAGYGGLIITDSLSSTALKGHDAYIGAASAGADLLLHVGDEAAGQAAYRHLVRAALSRRLSRSRLMASYRRIVAFKSKSAG